MKSIRLEKQADIIKSMAHPTRLLVVEALKKGERCVCELNTLVDIDQSTLSRHLLILKNAGIITSQKDAQKVYYKLKFPCVLKYMDCINGVLEID